MALRVPVLHYCDLHHVVPSMPLSNWASGRRSKSSSARDLTASHYHEDNSSKSKAHLNSAGREYIEARIYFMGGPIHEMFIFEGSSIFDKFKVGPCDTRVSNLTQALAGTSDTHGLFR